MQRQRTASRNQSTAVRRSFAAAAACLSLIGLAGCRQDMHNQPKFYPQRGTSFYADGRSVRPQVTGTVARGQEDAGSYFRTGMINGQEGDGLPIPLTMDLVERGQENFNVYCTACHSRVGNGKGMIVMRGYFPAGNLHTDRLRQAPLGHFFNVISNGYGAMPDYSAQVEPEDRWAIAAYIRALQLSQHATSADAGGARIEPMTVVEQHEGFAPGFISDWELPATATGIRQSSPAPTPAPMPASAAAMTTSSTAATPTATTKADPKAPAAVTAPTAATKAGGSSTSGSASASEGAATVPSKAAPAVSATEVASGEKLYQANCSPCHQANRQGMAPVIPSLVGIVGRVGAAHIHSVTTTGIMTGKVNMPSFTGKLTSGDVDKIIAYLAASK